MRDRRPSLDADGMPAKPMLGFWWRPRSPGGALEPVDVLHDGARPAQGPSLARSRWCSGNGAERSRRFLSLAVAHRHAGSAGTYLPNAVALPARYLLARSHRARNRGGRPDDHNQLHPPTTRGRSGLPGLTALVATSLRAILTDKPDTADEGDQALTERVEKPSRRCLRHRETMQGRPRRRHASSDHRVREVRSEDVKDVEKSDNRSTACTRISFLVKVSKAEMTARRAGVRRDHHVHPNLGIRRHHAKT